MAWSFSVSTVGGTRAKLIGLWLKKVLSVWRRAMSVSGRLGSIEPRNTLTLFLTAWLLAGPKLASSIGAAAGAGPATLTDGFSASMPGRKDAAIVDACAGASAVSQTVPAIPAIRRIELVNTSPIPLENL